MLFQKMPVINDFNYTAYSSQVSNMFDFPILKIQLYGGKDFI